MLLQGEDDAPECVKVQLFSELDYFFMYEHECYEADYKLIKEWQKLKPEFTDYSTMLIKLFN